MNILVFDIETVPDIESGKRIFGLENLSDADAAEAMFTQRLEQTGSDFLAHHLHKIVAISIVYRGYNDVFRVLSLGDLDSSEADLVKQFFGGIEKYSPTLVSWNGSGFDLQVLHYRALLHGTSAERYWEMGDTDQQFRWSNYINRYHLRHTDLMDLLSLYNLRAAAPLDQLAIMMGFPGKMGMKGDQVWPAYQKGELAEIRAYCETDVLNTYLIYLRFEVMRGHLTEDNYQAECQLVRDTLKASGQDHLVMFEEAWSGK